MLLGLVTPNQYGHCKTQTENWLYINTELEMFLTISDYFFICIINGAQEVPDIQTHGNTVLLQWNSDIDAETKEIKLLTKYYITKQL